MGQGNEPAYVAQLLYPNTRFPSQAMRLREQEDVGLRLCRLVEKRFPKKEGRADENDSELAHLPPLQANDYPDALPPRPTNKSATS